MVVSLSQIKSIINNADIDCICMYWIECIFFQKNCSIERKFQPLKLKSLNLRNRRIVKTLEGLISDRWFYCTELHSTSWGVGWHRNFFLWCSQLGAHSSRIHAALSERQSFLPLLCQALNKWWLPSDARTHSVLETVSQLLLQNSARFVCVRVTLPFDCRWCQHGKGHGISWSWVPVSCTCQRWRNGVCCHIIENISIN